MRIPGRGVGVHLATPSKTQPTDLYDLDQTNHDLYELCNLVPNTH